MGNRSSLARKRKAISKLRKEKSKEVFEEAKLEAKLFYDAVNALQKQPANRSTKETRQNEAT